VLSRQGCCCTAVRVERIGLDEYLNWRCTPHPGDAVGLAYHRFAQVGGVHGQARIRIPILAEAAQHSLRVLAAEPVRLRQDSSELSASF
jgi:hypothetical protein